MKKQNVIANAALLFVGTSLLGACATSNPNGTSEIGNVPETVANLAGPGQDLSTARYREDDGCFWYVHSGPVENTLLPLRTADGNPICAAREA
jgi:hypothetical protein